MGAPKPLTDPAHIAWRRRHMIRFLALDLPLMALFVVAVVYLGASGRREYIPLAALALAIVSSAIVWFAFINFSCPTCGTRRRIGTEATSCPSCGQKAF